MASYHCTANIGGAGAAAAHADYIGREGKHKNKPDDDDLEAVGHGNLPEWAGESPRTFWQAADEFERVNGSTYRELVVALPRELTPPQRKALVEAFVREELGDKHAFHWGIHNPRAALEGGEQPHAHIMYSERILDGIERSREHFFKRYNGKSPEKGGCKKASGGKTKDENVKALLVTRERWARVQNEHLARHAHDARVDHRSLKEQGIDREPERHLGQAQVQTQSEAVERVLAARADRTLAATLQIAIDAAQRRLARLQALSRAFVEKVARKSALVLDPALLVSSFDRVDELADFLNLISIERARAVKWGQQLEESLEGVPEREAARLAELKREAVGLKPPSRFASNATRQQYEERVTALRRDSHAAEAAEQKARKSLALSREFQSKPDPHVLDAIKRDHPGLVERIRPLTQDGELMQLAKQRLVERRQVEQKVDGIVRDLRLHAARRAVRADGYGDLDAQWVALPEPMRKMVEVLNQTPQQQRPSSIDEIRQRLLRDPAAAQNIDGRLFQSKVKNTIRNNR